jgi:hypothetical protein
VPGSPQKQRQTIGPTLSFPHLYAPQASAPCFPKQRQGMVRPRTGGRQSAIPMRAKNTSVSASLKSSDHRGVSCIQTRVKLIETQIVSSYVYDLA